MHERGQACAGTHEYCVEALFLHKAVDGGGLAHDEVAFELHAEFFKIVDFFSDNFLGKPEFGDAVYQNAAGLVKRLEYRDVEPFLDKFARGGKPRRARADNRRLFFRFSVSWQA